MEFSEDSDVSIIELDLMPTADHKDQVYCKCCSCAEKGYGGNWVSKRTRTRHKKTQRTHQKPTVVSSESSNSELLSDKDNDQINDKQKPVCGQDLSWLDSVIEMQNSFEIQDSFLPDVNAETSSENQELVTSSSDNEISQKS
ncbi:12800_t:CDS:2, partial [Racocetra persica]